MGKKHFGDAQYLEGRLITCTRSGRREGEGTLLSQLIHLESALRADADHRLISLAFQCDKANSLRQANRRNFCHICSLRLPKKTLHLLFRARPRPDLSHQPRRHTKDLVGTTPCPLVRMNNWPLTVATMATVDLTRPVLTMYTSGF